MKKRHLVKRISLTFWIWKKCPFYLWDPKHLLLFNRFHDRIVLRHTLKRDSMSKDDRRNLRYEIRVTRCIIIPNLVKMVIWRNEHRWLARLMISWRRRCYRLHLWWTLMKTLVRMKKNNSTIENVIQSHLYYCERSGKNMKYVRRVHRWVTIPWLTDMTT